MLAVKASYEGARVAFSTQGNSLYRHNRFGWAGTGRDEINHLCPDPSEFPTPPPSHAPHPIDGNFFFNLPILSLPQKFKMAAENFMKGIH